MEAIEEVLESLELIGVEVVEAGWLSELRDFELVLADGRALVFRDCLQASLYRPPTPPDGLAIESWWADEPSPVVLALDTRLRYLYSHVVFQIGEALLRVAFRELELTSEADEPEPEVNGNGVH